MTIVVLQVYTIQSFLIVIAPSVIVWYY